MAHILYFFSRYGFYVTLLGLVISLVIASFFFGVPFDQIKRNDFFMILGPGVIGFIPTLLKGHIKKANRRYVFNHGREAGGIITAVHLADFRLAVSDTESLPVHKYELAFKLADGRLFQTWFYDHYYRAVCYPDDRGMPAFSTGKNLTIKYDVSRPDNFIVVNEAYLQHDVQVADQLLRKKIDSLAAIYEIDPTPENKTRYIEEMEKYAASPSPEAELVNIYRQVIQKLQQKKE